MAPYCHNLTQLSGELRHSPDIIGKGQSGQTTAITGTEIMTISTSSGRPMRQ
jgi:hypothetical protein